MLGRVAPLTPPPYIATRCLALIAACSTSVLHWDQCIFEGSGTGPTIGIRPCLRNPVVNMLPIDGQLWLTIDTAEWGRVDPETLATIPDAKAQIKTLVLNAHPACDRDTHECFVQHPCPSNLSPISTAVCFSRLVTTETNMEAIELGRAQTAKSKTIQHSHSPCVTQNFVISKMDAFGT